MTVNYDYAYKKLSVEEGKKGKVYMDTMGIPTIGIGRNLRDVGLSEDEILYLFKNDVKRVQGEIDQFFPWAATLDEARYFVLFDMTFNMGPTKLSKFVNTLAALKAHDYEKTAQGMENSAWYKQVGNRAKTLVQMMRTGEKL